MQCARNAPQTGDAVETKDWVTGDWTICALAGPANRQVMHDLVQSVDCG